MVLQTIIGKKKKLGYQVITEFFVFLEKNIYQQFSRQLSISSFDFRAVFWHKTSLSGNEGFLFITNLLKSMDSKIYTFCQGVKIRYLYFDKYKLTGIKKMQLVSLPLSNVVMICFCHKLLANLIFFTYHKKKR